MAAHHEFAFQAYCLDGQQSKDIRQTPDGVQDEVGYALYEVQRGTKPRQAEVLAGFGNAKVLEIRVRAESGAYRAVYTIEYDDAIYILHVFQKKSKKGIATPKQEMDLIKARWRDARELHRARGKDKQL